MGEQSCFCFDSTIKKTNGAVQQIQGFGLNAPPKGITEGNPVRPTDQIPAEGFGFFMGEQSFFDLATSKK